jgi:hypothetical protein
MNAQFIKQLLSNGSFAAAPPAGRCARQPEGSIIGCGFVCHMAGGASAAAFCGGLSAASPPAATGLPQQPRLGRPRRQPYSLAAASFL